jgi:lycopene cyclase domain-containing protein
VTYTALSLVAVGLAVLNDLLIARTNLLLRKAFWMSYAIIAGFQLIMNGVLTGVAVVHYDRAAISGLRIVYAPVEDLLFGFAMILLSLTSWVWLGRRAAAGSTTR